MQFVISIQPISAKQKVVIIFCLSAALWNGPGYHSSWVCYVTVINRDIPRNCFVPLSCPRSSSEDNDMNLKCLFFFLFFSSLRNDSYSMFFGCVNLNSAQYTLLNEWSGISLSIVLPIPKIFQATISITSIFSSFWTMSTNLCSAQSLLHVLEFLCPLSLLYIFYSDK